MLSLSDSAEGACVLLFLRAPQLGRVKTRLAHTLGEAAALALYRAFVEDVLAAVAATGCPVLLCVTPAAQQPWVSAWLGQYPCWPQPEATLGERMAAAFEHAFRSGYERALVLGSDIPDLPPAAVATALRHLARHDAVIGPGADGGYYLIGFRSQTYCATVFDDMRWSAPDVLAETLRRFERAGLVPHLLPVWSDIDEAKDLVDLAWRLKQGTTCAPRTRQVLETLGRL